MIPIDKPIQWRAQWIDPEPLGKTKARRPASVLRRRFQCEHTEGARLYITAHGLYVARLNDQRVGEFVLAPGTDDYHKRLQYQCYDVSALLQPGENELLVTLGDGWYRGNAGVDGINGYYGDSLALLCQLEIEGAVVLCSDGQWEASQEGPVRENDLQLGERYDARREVISGWHGVTVRSFGYAGIFPCDGVPILEQERFSGTLLTTPGGERVIDFGQNLAGYVHFNLNARAGQTLTLWHGETLDEQGNFTQSNFEPGARNKNGGVPQRVDYICKDGRNDYSPHFTIHGFRYAKIETDIELADAEFTAVAVYSKMPQTGFFDCGNADINQLFSNSLWSMRSNFCDIPTDCPTRERAGWTGDIAAFAPTAVMLCDCYPILRKWLAACRDAQGADGLVQNIAPVNNSGSMISNMLQGSAGWGDACVIVPWVLYEAYGNTAILAENYDMMTRWLGYCERRARKTRRENRKNPYKEYLVDKGFHFGEWIQPDVSNMDAMKATMAHGAPEVATAYYHRSAALLSRIAQILGKTEDARSFAEIAEGARNAYRFTCTEEGYIRSDRQCHYVRPIAFGLLSEGEIAQAADDLAALVAQNGYHLNTGFLSTPFLCQVLADHGHVDAAYRLLLQEDCPGWLYPVRKGATTIWEAWDGIRADGTVRDSFNHYTFGAISGWLLRGVCGIRLAAGQLTLCPRPHRSLGYTKARWDSPVGTIASAWRYEGDVLSLDFTVPPDVQAEVRLPDGRIEMIGSGMHHFTMEG